MQEYILLELMILGPFGLFKLWGRKLLSNLTLENILEDAITVGVMQHTLTPHSFMLTVLRTVLMLYGLPRSYQMVNGLLKVTMVNIWQDVTLV